MMPMRAVIAAASGFARGGWVSTMQRAFPAQGPEPRAREGLSTQPSEHVGANMIRVRTRLAAGGKRIRTPGPTCGCGSLWAKTRVRERCSRIRQ
jgi:hypothetical protein